LVGRSDPVREVLSTLHAIAGTDATVLVEGESGTGKELVARIIHEISHRSGGPFVAVACAALPRELVEAELFGHEAGAFTGAVKRRLGRFELAHGGTLFLDDIDDVPLEVQVKLVRAIQERTIERIGSGESLSVNIRIVAATKRSLASMVVEGEFREDLYYRLKVVPLYLPPLRERTDDIPLLVEHFLEAAATKFNRPTPTVEKEAMQRLCQYSWPGNVRELEHVAEQAVVLSRSSTLSVADLPPLVDPVSALSRVHLNLEGANRIDLQAAVQELERRAVKWALRRADGNLAQAAELLSVPRSTLQYKLSKLDPEDGAS